MRHPVRNGIIAALAIAALAAAVGAPVVAMSELRGALLLRLSPKTFRDDVFLRYADAKGGAVYLLGGIHDAHLTTRDYSLQNVAAAVLHLRPDLLLVEERPEEMARGNWADGPLEAGFASLTAKAAGIPVQGVDWWTMNSSHQVDSDEREARIFANVSAALPGHRTVLVLIGFAHLDALQAKLAAAGYRQTEFGDADKDRLFDVAGAPATFPPGMTAAVQRRIAADEATLASQTDPFWRGRLSNVIAARRALLKSIAATGERGS